MCAAKDSCWYAAGLAFECTECGRCCSGPEEGYVWISRDEIAEAAAAMKLSADAFFERYCRKVGKRISLIEQANCDCIFLADRGEGKRGCSIYQYRPMQCRTWPFWHYNLRSPAAWAAAQDRCPGINRGMLYDRETIDKRANATG